MAYLIRIVLCAITGSSLIATGIRTPPLGFLFTVAGILLIVYGFSPGQAKTVIKELSAIAKKLIDGIFGR